MRVFLWNWKALGFLIGDIAAIILAVVFAFLLRFDGRIPEQYFLGPLQTGIGLALVATIPSFMFFRLYSFSWAHVSTPDLLLVGRGVLLSFFSAGTVILVFRELPFFLEFPRSILFIAYLFIFLFAVALRIGKRAWHEFTLPSRQAKGERMLVVGAGDAGTQIARNILTGQETQYNLIGFVDDANYKVGSILFGVRVLGKIDDLPNLVEDKHIESVVIALPSAGLMPLRKAVELSRKAGIQKIKIIPPLNELISGVVSMKDVREVQIEDLLGREPLLFETESVQQLLQNKAVLITGAAGSIGAELCRQVSRFSPSQLILVDQDETSMFHITEELKDKFPKLSFHAFVADIRDNRKMKQVFEQFRPAIVLHAAAYKHVPLMEKNLDEAVKNNILGTKIIAESALGAGSERFILISTDKAVNPTSVMGATKRAGEMLCQVLNQKNQTKFISVRFGNVLNSRGSVIPIFREQIARKGPVEVTDPEMKRYFMLISEACLLVLNAAALGEGGEVFVLDMGKPMNIFELAKEMIRLSGFEPDKDIPIVFSGKRPGEKLFEDILSAEEGTVATSNQKIFRAKLSSVYAEEFEKLLQELEGVLETSSAQAILEKLSHLVPTFKP